jgi:3',5'-cyclic AMP phosphodiesterase CpdA
VIVAHLSDLHLRDEDDAAGFALRLDRVVARQPDHLVITGDLLDRWSPPLLDAALNALEARGLLHRDRLTIIHGNHDLASSGGHPRERSDLWRLVTRFWDPPPLLAARRRAFYQRIGRRADGVAAAAPSIKTTAAGLRFAVLDTVPLPWRPLSLGRKRITLRHGEGAIAASQTDWLAQQRGSGSLVVLIHHYPLRVAPFHFDIATRFDTGTANGGWRRSRDGRSSCRWRSPAQTAIVSGRQSMRQAHRSCYAATCIAHGSSNTVGRRLD